MIIDIESCDIEVSLTNDIVYTETDGVRIYDIDVTGDSIVATLWLPKKIINRLHAENAGDTVAADVWVGDDEYAAEFPANKLFPQNQVMDVSGELGQVVGVVGYNYDIIAL